MPRVIRLFVVGQQAENAALGGRLGRFAAVTHAFLALAQQLDRRGANAAKHPFVGATFAAGLVGRLESPAHRQTHDVIGVGAVSGKGARAYSVQAE